MKKAAPAASMFIIGRRLTAGGCRRRAANLPDRSVPQHLSRPGCWGKNANLETKKDCSLEEADKLF